MNFSEFAIKPSSYPAKSSEFPDNVQHLKQNNITAFSSPDEVHHNIDSKLTDDESIIYDLEEFKEAKKDWIKNFFYSKKNGLKKLVGLKENDDSHSQTEETGLIVADAPVNRTLPLEAEVSLLKGKSEFPSGKKRSIEDLQKKKEVNTESFKRIRIDLKKIKADTKQHIKVFLRTIKTANSEYITRKKIELEVFSEQQKMSTARTLTRRSEYCKFFQNFKPEVWEHFTRKKEAIGEFFDTQSEQTQKIILAKKQDLINADCPDKSRKATRKYIKAQQKKLKKIVDKKEKSAKKELKEIKREFDKHTNAKKKSLKKSIKPDTNNEGELQALVESNRQEMKDFISSQNDIIKSLIDLNKSAPSPARTFTDHNEIKENLNVISPFIKTAYTAESPASALKKPIKILVAEDDLLLRKSLSFYLSHNGFDVVQVTNGLEAMDEITKNPFDVIILDLQMPHMGGLELIDRVRNQLHLHTKIIVLTASGVEEVELKSFSMGATDFIAKPFSPSVVKARIEKIMADDDAD